MLTMMRTRTFWIVAVVLLGYGIIQIGDDDPGESKEKAKGDDRVTVILEVAMADVNQNSVQVAIAATLGSAGKWNDRSAKIWDGIRYPNRNYVHPFQARRGDAVNAEAVNLSPSPPSLLSCFFWQKDQGNDTIPGQGDGFGDITGPHLDSVKGMNPARCAAVVR